MHARPGARSGGKERVWLSDATVRSVEALSAPETATTRRSPRRCCTGPVAALSACPTNCSFRCILHTQPSLRFTGTCRRSAEWEGFENEKFFPSILFFFFISPVRFRSHPLFILGSWFASLRFAWQRTVFALQTRDVTCGPFVEMQDSSSTIREKCEWKKKEDYYYLTLPYLLFAQVSNKFFSFELVLRMATVRE
ncbi:hypothetical protein LI328DRAFT_159360 [Trichoderma asperelloides]|nr:hypothetical protein LI328DRAFT_159360 [Trichoderma asperelloides]